MKSRVVRYVLCILALSGLVSANASQPKKFLVFSSHISSDWIAMHGSDYVYVWGSGDGGSAQATDAEAAWTRYAPETTLSTYFPYGRDPDRRPPQFWLASHPEWIAYRCDGTSIAFQFGQKIVPLNIADRAVMSWQIKNFLDAPQRSIALDNFQTKNWEGICGVKLSDGTFETLYPPDRTGAAKMAEVKLSWLEQVARALHEAGITLTINYELDQPVGSRAVLRIVKAVDGILLEEPYEDLIAHPGKFHDLLAFATYVQSQGKHYYSIYEIDMEAPGELESAMATYLLTAGDRTAVFISGIQRYGRVPDFQGFDRPLGDPCGALEIRDGTIVRRFTQGLVIMRDPSLPAAIVSIPAGYNLVDGAASRREALFEPGQGLVLYKPTMNACEKEHGSSPGRSMQ